MNVALIPVRGGSKSIPLKNIKEICGQPLVYWVVKAAEECEMVDRVYVSTDSPLIREAVDKFGFSKVEVIGRSPETATDAASTESVMLEFAETYEFDRIALIQATSPLLVSEDLDRGFLEMEKDGTDSVLSVVRQKRFQWELNENGWALPANYDYMNRPRRQEFDGYFVENGAFYITTKSNLLQSKCRISGNIRMVEMKEESYYEIDEPSDFEIVAKMMESSNKVVKEPIRELFKESTKESTVEPIKVPIRTLTKESYTKPHIKMFLTDCDGCLTDGGMYYFESGDEGKKFNAVDGMGFRLLREKGIITGIISGETNQILERRAKKLQIDILRMGVTDKAAALKEILATMPIKPEEIVYVGDDINDLEIMEMVGMPCCVKNACDSVKKKAVYISEKEGGKGAVREIIDFLCTG
jgi:N-acylneuraminate cytidylyltransferase